MVGICRILKLLVEVMHIFSPYTLIPLKQPFISPVSTARTNILLYDKESQKVCTTTPLELNYLSFICSLDRRHITGCLPNRTFPLSAWYTLEDSNL